MDHFDRSRLPPPQPPPSYSTFPTSSPYPPEPQRIIIPQEQLPEDKLEPSPVFMKGPKRKRLAKVDLLIVSPSLVPCAHNHLGLRRLS